MKKTYFIVTLFVAIILTGCEQTSGINTRLNVRTAEYLNPDIQGKASPVVISIYELKTQNTFNQLNYQKLTSNPNDELKNDLIDIHTLEVRPDSQQRITLYINKNTRYLGIIAGYRAINNAQWRKIIAMSNHNRHLSMDITLETNNMIVNHIN